MGNMLFMVKKCLIFCIAITLFLPLFSPQVSAATYTGCTNWRTVNNPWTGLPITPGSNQRYANLNSMDLSCMDLSGVDFYGAVIGSIIWTNSNLTNTNFGGTGYCGGIFTGADVAGSNLKLSSTWSCAYRTDVYVAPASTTTTLTTPETNPPISTTTTSTLPSTSTTTSTLPMTTTTLAPNFYCLKIGSLGVSVRWLHSRDVNWGNPSYQTTPTAGVQVMTLSTWLGKTNEQKLDTVPESRVFHP